MPTSQPLTLLDQHLVLLPERVLFWREAKMLIVADLHFGKAQFFRDRGIPIPGGTTAGDLARLTSLIDRLKPEKVLFLGDLIHGRIDDPIVFNRLIEQWRRRHHQVELLLSTGNHDRHAGETAHHFRIDHMANTIIRDPFVFSHHPKPGGSYYQIAGHLHPAVSLRGMGRLKEILPCFCFGSRTALLPAFGSFTGNQLIRPAIGDRIYVVAGDDVLKM